MIFFKEDYTYIPPELMDDIFDASEDVEDVDEEISHADSASKSDSETDKPKWVWPDGKNSPEYNAWYWDTHKDEIMARREELQAERARDAQYGNDEYYEDLLKAANENLSKHSVSLNDKKNVRIAINKEMEKLVSAREAGMHQRRSSNKNALRGSGNTSSDKDTNTSKENKEEEKSSKKKSGSGSGGSSKKSSSKSGSGKSSNGSGSGKKSGGGGGKSGSSSSGGKKSSGESSGKEKSAKETADKAKKDSTTTSGNGSTSEELVKRTSPSGKVYNYDTHAMQEINDSFAKTASMENNNEDSPERNYESFIRTFINNGYHEVELDEGLELWKMYREYRGFKSSDKEIKEEMERQNKKKRLQHGMDTFEDALEHHGILGMRWGVQNGPPYPLSYEAHNASEKKAGWHTSLSSASQKALAAERKVAAGAKKAYETAKPVAKKAGVSVVKAGKATVTAAKNANAKVKANKQAKKEAAEEKARVEYQRNRENAIKEGNSKYAREHFRELSNDEVNELLRRLDLSKKVDKANNVKTMADRIDDMMDNVTRAKNWTDKGSAAWNSFAKLYNTMNGDNPLPIIGEDFERTKRAIAKEKEERAKAAAEKTRKEWFDRVTKDPKLIEKYFDQFDNNEARTALQRYRDDTSMKGEISSAEQDRLFKDIMLHPEKATAENLSKLDSNHVQSYLNMNQNIDKITADDSWVNGLLKASPEERSKFNTANLNASQQKRAYEVLNNENNLRKALNGEFGKNGGNKSGGTSTESAGDTAARLPSGLSNGEIRSRLSDVGYSDDYIDKVISEYEG